MKLQYSTTNNPKETISLSVETLEDAKHLSKDLHRDIELYVVDFPFTPKLTETLKLSSLTWLLNSRNNPNGLKQHILMLESGKLSDSDFWNVIKQIDWASDLDFKRISNEFDNGVYGSKGFALSVSYKFDEMKSKLMKAIDEQIIYKELDYYDVIGLGDDGFDDLCSNIIGMGQKVYEKALIDPEYAGSLNTNESFAYSFQFEN